MNIFSLFYSLRGCLWAIMWLVGYMAFAQTDVTREEVKNAGLYIVDITTVDGEEPEGEIISSPVNPDLHNITYKNKVPCRVVICLAEDTLYDSGVYEEKASGAIVRINGNTSALNSNPLNMPYHIKLERAADLLLRDNDDVYADKHWSLLKGVVPIKTMVSLKLSKLMEMEWTVNYFPCNVIINGDYRGFYLLTETVKRNNKCRIKCKKEGGVIIERDPYWWKENRYFSSDWYCDETNSMYRWTWKYPDEEDVDEATDQYVQQYIIDTERSLTDGSYTDYIDVESWAKWVLVHDILGTYDSGGSNMYFKIYDIADNGHLEMPCVWDFDSCFDVVPGRFSRVHLSSHAYFTSLFNSNNKEFAVRYAYIWNQKKDYVITSLVDCINEFSDSEEAAAWDESIRLYNKRWGFDYDNTEKGVRQALEWFDSHIDLLDRNINYIISGITCQYNDIENNCFIYNINGQRIGKPQKGFYILNGKKYLQITNE